MLGLNLQAAAKFEKTGVKTQPAEVTTTELKTEENISPTILPEGPESSKEASKEASKETGKEENPEEIQKAPKIAAPGELEKAPAGKTWKWKEIAEGWHKVAEEKKDKLAFLFTERGLYHHLAVILDHTNSEFNFTSTQPEHRAATYTVANMFLNSTPTLCSISLIQNLIQQGQQAESKQALEAMRKVNAAGVTAEERQKFYTAFGLRPFSFLLETISPKLSEFIFFTHNTKPLVLMIPKSYARQQKVAFENQIRKNRAALNIWGQDLDRNMAELYANSKSAESKETREQLMGLLKDKKKFGQEVARLDALNIKLKKAAGNDTQLTLIYCGFEPNIFTQQAITSWAQFQTLPAAAISSAEQLDGLKTSLAQRHESIGQLLLYLAGHGTSSYAAPILSGGNFDITRSFVADFKFHDYTDFLAHLHEKCETAFVLSISCLSGGVNQKFIEQSLQNQSLSFYLAALGVADTSVAAHVGKYSFSSRGVLTYVAPPVSNFFRMVESNLNSDVVESIRLGLSSKRSIFSGSKIPEEVLKNIWAKAFESINEKNWFMRFPGVNKVFTSSRLESGEVLTLTSVLDKSRRHAKRPIDASKKSLVLIYPQNVASKLHVGKNTKIAFTQQPVLPSVIAPLTPAMFHYIISKKTMLSDVEMDCDFVTFLFNALSFFGPHPTTVHIKKLIEKGLKEEIKDVIISGKIPGSIAIAFTWGNMRKSGVLLVQKLSLEDLKKRLQGLPPTMILAEIRNNCTRPDFKLKDWYNKLPRGRGVRTLRDAAIHILNAEVKKIMSTGDKAAVKNAIEKLPDGFVKLETMSRYQKKYNEMIDDLDAIDIIMRINAQEGEVQNANGNDVDEGEVALETMGIRRISTISDRLNIRNEIRPIDDLNLSGNHIEKIEGLDQLTSLHRLQLEVNEIATIEGLDQLTKLDHLDLSMNKITEIKGLDKNTKLSNLQLDKNLITRITGLDRLTGLKELSLFNNPGLERSPGYAKQIAALEARGVEVS